MHLSSQRLQYKFHSQTEVGSGWGRPCRRSVAAWGGINPSHHSQQYNKRQCCQAQQYDLIGLSNLCVDVVVNVDSLPGKNEQKRLQLLHQVIGHGCGICLASLCLAAAAIAHLTHTLRHAADSSTAIRGALGAGRQLQLSDSSKWDSKSNQLTADRLLSLLSATRW